jgi:hypothetical protein
VKSKIIVHRRINKTFAANTPEQSCDKPVKAIQGIGGMPPSAGGKKPQIVR